MKNAISGGRSPFIYDFRSDTRPNRVYHIGPMFWNWVEHPGGDREMSFERTLLPVVSPTAWYTTKASNRKSNENSQAMGRLFRSFFQKGQ